MKKFLAAAGCALLLSASLSAAASAPATTLTIDGADFTAEAMVHVWNNTTYVSLRALSGALDGSAAVSWDHSVAWVQAEGLLLAAKPGRIPGGTDRRRQRGAQPGCKPRFSGYHLRSDL